VHVVLVVVLVVMVGAAALAPVLALRLRQNTGYVLSIVFFALCLLLLGVGRDVASGETVTAEATWIPSLDIAFRLQLDGLSLLFSIVVLGVGGLIMLYTPSYLSDQESHAGLYGILTLFAGAMLLLVLSADIVLMFVGWELTTLCSFLLVGGRGLAGAAPASRAFIVTAGGGLALFAAVVLLSVAGGTTDLTLILTRVPEIAASPLYPVIGALIVTAALSKSAQLPLHFWLPDAMVAITPVSAYLHAATLVKGGVYLLLRFSPLYADQFEWHLVLMGVGLITAVVGAVLALKQHDLKAILAYSTVSQLGFIIALVGVGTALALAAATLHTFAHALFKATLFMLVGIIDRQAGGRDIRELPRLWQVMPITATLTAAAAVSMAGIAPFVGFVSKEEAFAAFLSAPQASWTPDGTAWTGALAAGMAVTAAALTFAYGFRILYGAFGGSDKPSDLYEPSFWFWFPVAIPAVAGLLLGLRPDVLNSVVNRSVLDTSFEVKEADLALWHGFTLALALSVLTVAVGTLLFVHRDRVDAVLQRWRLPFTGADVFDRLYGAAIAFGAWVGSPTRTGRTSRHLLHPIVGLLLVVAVGTIALVRASHPLTDTSRTSDWWLLVLLVVPLLALVMATNRMATLILLGVVGLVVALWFLLLGAPDLALTQLLVEILTVVVAVLVIRRLPERFRTVPRASRLGAAALALTAGAGIAVTTLLLTGQRQRSSVADYLLARAEEDTGGTNVVNTVLVDYRGLDTLGEIAVVGVAALGLLAVLSATRRGPSLTSTREEPDGAWVVFRLVSRGVGPVVIVLAVLLLLRGHNQPGGGFIAALVASAGLAIAQLPRGPEAGPRLRAVPLVAVGLVVAVLTGLLGLLDGSFLRPLGTTLQLAGLDVKLTTSLIFDVGVFLVVVGLTVAALDRLARGTVPAGRPQPPTSVAGGES
jgi:multicomponent Na+:H+ antiporter subunit A